MHIKKLLITLSAVILVAVVYVGYTQTVVDAGCKCISAGTVDQEEGAWVYFDDGSNPPAALAGCDGAAAAAGGGSTGAAGSCMESVYPGCGECNPLSQGKINLWFRVPTLGDLIGNALRLIFFIAGLYALVLLLLGGFEWVSSGGDDKKLSSARGKIINAIIGLVVMVAVLTLVILLEQVVFGGKVCLGISCPINMGDLRIIR
ncbi:MAG TPA: hypothetical protein PKG71_03255 [Candidatus Woesebacteria bacterium]|nr:hypothetical protein [Candidatus Woesebacteria bacterium]HNS94961.1 hypothetical protein [Candidatus Woesebacteria bacterium]